MVLLIKILEFDSDDKSCLVGEEIPCRSDEVPAKLCNETSSNGSGGFIE